MTNKLLIALSAGSLTLFLCTACAEDNTASTNAITDAKVITEASEEGAGLMTQAVDFSSPEAVEKTLENILEKEGKQAHTALKNAMQYILVYDLSVRNNQEKLYKKLNGRTPEQIIAKMKR